MAQPPAHASNAEYEAWLRLVDEEPSIAAVALASSAIPVAEQARSPTPGTPDQSVPSPVPALPAPRQLRQSVSQLEASRRFRRRRKEEVAIMQLQVQGLAVRSQQLEKEHLKLSAKNEALEAMVDTTDDVLHTVVDGLQGMSLAGDATSAAMRLIAPPAPGAAGPRTPASQPFLLPQRPQQQQQLPHAPQPAVAPNGAPPTQPSAAPVTQENGVHAGMRGDQPAGNAGNAEEGRPAVAPVSAASAAAVEAAVLALTEVTAATAKSAADFAVDVAVVHELRELVNASIPQLRAFLAAADGPQADQAARHQVEQVRTGSKRRFCYLASRHPISVRVLKTLDLSTGLVSAIPPEHWHKVAAASKISLENQEKIVAAWEIMGGKIQECLEERAGYIRRLAQARQGTAPDSGELEEVLAGLDRTMQLEATIDNSFYNSLYMFISPLEGARMSVASYPFYNDLAEVAKHAMAPFVRQQRGA